jgi:hypothetical protein
MEIAENITLIAAILWIVWQFLSLITSAGRFSTIFLARIMMPLPHYFCSIKKPLESCLTLRAPIRKLSIGRVKILWLLDNPTASIYFLLRHSKQYEFVIRMGQGFC